MVRWRHCPTAGLPVVARDPPACAGAVMVRATTAPAAARSRVGPESVMVWSSSGRMHAADPPRHESTAYDRSRSYRTNGPSAGTGPATTVDVPEPADHEEPLMPVATPEIYAQMLDTAKEK